MTVIPIRRKPALSGDEIEEVSTQYGKVYRCIEQACELKPQHAHSKRPYLVYADRLLKERR